MTDFTALTAAVEKAEIITIYRHVHPDCDALGSQFGLKTWIQDNYPDKKVYALGSETTDQAPFPAYDEVSDDTIRHSLAIVLDTADRPRIDDQRFSMAQTMIKIDHHPEVDPYGNLSWVKPDYAAASEILGEYFSSRPECHVSEETARYLYEGILTDTLCYSTSNTTAHTLQIGSYLASFGINIPEINRTLFDKSLHDFTFGSFVRSRIQTKGDHVAYVILSREDLNKWGISAPKARTYVTEMGHVREFDAWAIFTEKELGIYDGSLRSKIIAVNDIAADFHGGGHKNASGVKDLTEEDIHTIINRIGARVAN